ncbi:MAG: MSMEG_0568 family radical SAM protein [Promethearchaeota archaeon]
MVKSIAELKIELMAYGMRSEVGVNKGRTGGAGPAGGRFFQLKDGSCVNVPFLPKFIEKSPYILKDNQAFFKNTPLNDIKLIPVPKFYSKLTSDNIPFKKIALLHGTDCIASTIVQSCAYWNQNLHCRFCGIELSLQSNSTIAVKSPKQLKEVIGAAINEKVCRHITLTIGSLARPDKGAGIYAEIVKEIKQYYDVPIHIQLEPPQKFNCLDNLFKIGVDTIGIHIESFDQDVLRAVCPGKTNISLEKYKDTWKYTVQLFGENQVSSFILVGLGESDDSILNGTKLLLELGVIPYIVPFRPIEGTPMENTPPQSYSRLLNLFTNVAQLLRDYGVDPTKNKAGCVRCGGCSPLTEAFKYL